MHLKEGCRGQITVMVILALVILFVFAFMIYVQGLIYRSQIATQADAQLKSYIDQNSVNQYITSCLDYISDEAIVRASMQGGVMNFTGMIQGIDYIPRFSPEYNRTFNVSVVVRPNIYCPLVYHNIPDYPYPLTKINPADDLISLYSSSQCGYSTDRYLRASGFFGLNNLTKLCNKYGTNKVGATPLIPGYGYKTCLDDSYSDGVKPSLQQELEHFISKELSKCINFSTIIDKSGSNITFLSDRPNTTVTFGNDGMLVRLQYPFLITIGNRPPVMKMVDFSYNKDVAFKELYDYSFVALTTDTRSAAFDFRHNKSLFGLMQYYRTSYNIAYTKSNDSFFVDLVQINDTDTLIYGKPLLMQFYIKNRGPALEYINIYSGFNNINMLGAENTTLEISPQGHDPDDNEILLYNYSGWKEDYDAWYNYSNSICANPTQQQIEYVKANCSIKNSSIVPRKWTGSAAFGATGRVASYFTNSTDIGYHEVTVYTAEKFRQKLDDFQTIKIFVVDKPKARIILNNFYDDVPDIYASFEDPYMLNGTNTSIGLSAVVPPYAFFTKLKWDDITKHEFSFEKTIMSDNHKILILPFHLNSSVGFLNITDYVFLKATGPATHTIELTAFTSVPGLSDSATASVDVKQCLPHRSNNKIYPYNNNPSDINDSLFANHTCCSNSTGSYGTILGSSVNPAVCFHSVAYGSNFSFINYKNRQPSPPLPYLFLYQSLTGGILTTPTQLKGIDNDIFIQTFSRFCSDRGNACLGPAHETRKIKQQCADDNGINNNAFQNERCSGPPIDVLKHFINSTTDNIKCVNYSTIHVYRPSFEKLATINGLTYPVGSSDGICTSSKQCASGFGGQFKAYNNFVVARYACDGTCGSFGNNLGKCSTPINCKCDSSLCAAGSGSSRCDGLSSNSYPLDPNRGCTLNTKFADYCSSCSIIVDPNKICRNNTYHTGCSAHPDCNGIPAGTVIGGNGNVFCTDQCEKYDCGVYNYKVSQNRCYNPSDDCVNNAGVCSYLGTCCTTVGLCGAVGGCYDASAGLPT